MSYLIGYICCVVVACGCIMYLARIAPVMKEGDSGMEYDKQEE